LGVIFVIESAMTKHIFLSYTDEGKNMALAIAKEFAGSGLTVWLKDVNLGKYVIIQVLN